MLLCLQKKEIFLLVDSQEVNEKSKLLKLLMQAMQKIAYVAVFKLNDAEMTNGTQDALSKRVKMTKTAFVVVSSSDLTVSAVQTVRNKDYYTTFFFDCGENRKHCTILYLVFKIVLYLHDIRIHRYTVL